MRLFAFDIKPASLPARRLHRFSGAVVGVYVFFHLLNHLTALAGIDAHTAVMHTLRHVYRWPPAEFVLLFCFACQIGTGITLLFRRRTPRQGFFDRLQAWSGAYLAFFIIVHVSAVLYARHVSGVETDFHFAAAGLKRWPQVLFFAPYYFLAVAAFVAHAACAVRRLAGQASRAPSSRDAFARAAAAAGAALALLIVATFAGAFYPVII